MAIGLTNFFQRTFWVNNTPPAINEANLNNVESGIAELDNRTVQLDTEKADLSVVNTLVSDIQINEKSGIITVAYKNGSTKTIQTNLNQIAVNWDFDEENQQLIIVLEDGTEKPVDLSALITEYEFMDTDTVSFFVDESGKVSAIVKEGSIEEKHLRPNYLADIKVEVGKAEIASKSAQTADMGAQYNAKLAQSYAVGSSGIRESEDVDNAKFYYEGAKAAGQEVSGVKDEIAKLAENVSANAESAVEAKNAAQSAAGSAQQNAETSAGHANSAARSAVSAEESKTAAAQSVQNAKASEEAAAGSEESANQNALLAESYFHGGTGIREGEDEENVVILYEKIQAVADLDIATQTKAGLVKAGEDVHVAADGVMSVPKLSELESLIKGASSAKVCGTLQEMSDELNGASLADFVVGTNILIKAVGVPDFWISEVYTERLTFVYVSDEDLVNRVNLSGGTLQVGYYGISFLETDKVDLTGTTSETYVNTKFNEAVEHSDANLETAKEYTDNKVLLAASNQQPTFSQAAVRENIVSGEKMSVILGKIRKWFSDLKTVAFTGSYNDLTNKPAIPSVGNGTVTITQNGVNKGSFSMNQSGNTSIALSDTNTDTWRPVQDNLNSRSATDSLSANMGWHLANGYARDDTKLLLSGGTITGTIYTNQGARYQPDGNIYMTWAGANTYLSTYLENMQNSSGAKTINSSGQTIFSVVHAAASNMMYFNVDSGRFSDGPSRNGVSPEGWLWILVDGITTRKMAIYFAYGQTDPGMVFWYRCYYNGNWTTDWIYTR